MLWQRANLPALLLPLLAPATIAAAAAAVVVVIVVICAWSWMNRRERGEEMPKN